MTNKSYRFLITMFFVFICSNALAFDVNNFDPKDCGQLLSASFVQGKINNYKDNGLLQADGTYVLCFKPDLFKTPATIIIKPDDRLLIYGLRLQPSNENLEGPLVQFLGKVFIIAQNMKLEGNGKGVAMQVGDGVNASSNVTIKENNFSNFPEGIRVAKNASAFIAKNDFESVKKLLVFEDPVIQSPVDVNMVGKKINEDDPGKFDYIVGKINSDKCNGAIEIYYQLNEFTIKHYENAHCEPPTTQHEAYNLEAKDGSEPLVIPDKMCAFKCDNVTLETVSKISFLFSSRVAGETSPSTRPFVPEDFIQLSDLSGITFTGLGGTSIPGTVSEMGGGDVINVPLGNDSADSISAEASVINVAQGDANADVKTVADIDNVADAAAAAPACEGEGCVSFDPSVIPDIKTQEVVVDDKNTQASNSDPLPLTSGQGASAGCSIMNDSGETNNNFAGALIIGIAISCPILARRRFI